MLFDWWVLDASLGSLKGWRWARVGELCERVSVGYVSSTRAYFCEPGEGVPLIRSQNIRPGRLDLKDVAWVTREFHDQNPKSQLKAGDVLFTRVGANAGDVCIVPDDTQELHLSSAVYARPYKQHQKYLELFFRSDLGQMLLKSRIVGSVSERINTRDVENLEVLLPPVDEEQAIASILGVLDEKIELNRRMSTTLDATARGLFRSWFVDFDPVRAKAKGSDPRLPTEIATLFPDSFENSALGEIPKGWRVTPLSKIMTFEGGTQPPASTFISEPRAGYVRLVQIRDFYTNSHITYIPDSPKLRKFTDSDIMIARYGSSGGGSKANDSLGRICRGLSGAYNVALVKVVPKAPLSEFLYCFLHTNAFRSAITGMGARSVQSGFRKVDLDVIPLVTADSPIHKIFESFGQKIWMRRFQASKESKTLALLRDTLLPKLISGEIRIRDAERLVKQSV